MKGRRVAFPARKMDGTARGVAAGCLCVCVCVCARACVVMAVEVAVAVAVVVCWVGGGGEGCVGKEMGRGGRGGWWRGSSVGVWVGAWADEDAERC